MELPAYAVYALRYATVARQARENFIAADPHEGPGSMDYFVWAIVGPDETIVVDTGFTAAAAQRRQRSFLRCPAEALLGLGIDAQAVQDVVITHLHYDHAGNLDKFPAARFHLQETEIAFATGPCMCEPFLRHAYDVEDVVQMVRNVHAGRVQFHRGDVELRAGISLHRIGGHTDGLQAVRVHTERGWIVLASDAAHYTDNLRRRSPFPIVYHVGDMLRGFDRLRALADSHEHIIPGHDPSVLRQYPAALVGVPDVVALHRAPTAAG
ncbi:MAG TPA: N-acyl homoserine lactonase family protein [Ramlibacter sp.]|nr:N-acyl homoserine lactonase family protein [Ramlibacter sp.]